MSRVKHLLEVVTNNTSDEELNEFVSALGCEVKFDTPVLDTILLDILSRGPENYFNFCDPYDFSVIERLLKVATRVESIINYGSEHVVSAQSL